MADRVGCRRIAGQCQSLTAASTPIEFLAWAGPARFTHPRGATKAAECGGRGPYLRQRPVLHSGEFEPRNAGGGMARQHGAIGGDDEELSPPSAHARLGFVAEPV